LEELEKLGHLDVYNKNSYDLKGKDLIGQRCKNVEIVLTNKTLMNGEIIRNMSTCRFT